MTAVVVWLFGLGAFGLYSIGVYAYRKFVNHEDITFLEALIGDGKY